jgi:hypothetical protein
MKHFGKDALTALFVTMLIGTAVGCSDETPSESSVVDGIMDVADYLAKADGRAAADDPVQLSVNINLAIGGWEALLTAIRTSGKYVVLNLSGCRMIGTEFEHGAGGAGADKITALVLPAAAKSIGFTFMGFTSLKCTSLVSMSLPAAPTTIATTVGEGYNYGMVSSLGPALPEPSRSLSPPARFLRIPRPGVWMQVPRLAVVTAVYATYRLAQSSLDYRIKFNAIDVGMRRGKATGCLTPEGCLTPDGGQRTPFDDNSYEVV